MLKFHIEFVSVFMLACTIVVGDANAISVA